MAEIEVLVEFDTPITARDGGIYKARACGAQMRGGLWQAWIEFLPIGGGDPVRSPRETTQPNRADTIYWATGLSPVYLEGSLRRAQDQVIRPPERETLRAIFDTPALRRIE